MDLDFEQLELLGQGMGSKVYKVQSVYEKKIYALKMIEKSFVETETNKDFLLREYQLQKLVNHPNIVRSISFFETDDHLCFLLEFCGNETLQDRLELMGGKFTESQCRYWIKQILNAVDVIHTARIIHRDIKLPNMFITENNVVKLGDFGFATAIEDIDDDVLCGTPNYLPPEAIERQVYGTFTDIWSIGVCLYTMLVGYSPFQGKTPDDTLQNVKLCRVHMPPTISDNARNFIIRCMQKDYTRRSSVYELQKHPFLDGY